MCLATRQKPRAGRGALSEKGGGGGKAYLRQAPCHGKCARFASLQRYIGTRGGGGDKEVRREDGDDFAKGVPPVAALVQPLPAGKQRCDLSFINSSINSLFSYGKL